MFPGNSTLNQLERIISFTGNPSKEDISSLNSEVAISMIGSINQFRVKDIKDWFKSDTPPDAINLICKMLEFNPNKRPTANEILKHPYFSKFHNPKEEYDSPKIIYPPVSDNKKLNLKQYRQLIYDRIKKIYKNYEEEPSAKRSHYSSNGRAHQGASEHRSVHKEDHHHRSHHE